MKIRSIKNIAMEFAKESTGSKFSYIVFFFVIILLYFSLIISIMAVQEEKKVLSDFFIATTHLSLFIFAIFSMSVGISSDIETKRIYMILSRPIKRYEYLIARAIGVYFSSFLLLVLITLLCVIIFVIKGYFIDFVYLRTLFLIFIKIINITSFTLLFVSITSSAFTSIAISVMMWFVANFVSELKFALSKSDSFLAYTKYFLYIFPDFSLTSTLWGNLYLIIYSFFIIILASYFFNKMEI